MKIIINTSTIHVGGAVQVAINIIKNSFLQKSDEIYYITNQVVYEACSTDLERTMIVSKSPASIFGFEAKRQIKSFANLINPDIIYSVGAPSYINFKQKEVLRLTNPWIINSLNSDVYKIYNYKQRLLMKLKVVVQRLYLRKTTFFITQTCDAKEKIVLNLNKLENNVFVIENTFSQTFKEYVGNHVERDYNNRINVLSIAAPYPHKNLILLVKIAKKLKETNNNKFHFIITYPEKEYLHSDLFKEINKFDVKDYFTNLGKVSLEELPKIYSESHILLLPTLLEVFSASLLEAMVFNLPIITTKFSFNTEVCGKGAIYLDNPYDEEDALQKLNFLIESESVRNTLIDCGKEVFNKSVSWDNIYNKHFEVLNEICNSKN